jgi:hypothetical protein
MGMDVYGRKPDSEEGKYFRANIWSWRPIYSLICELCSDLLSEKTLMGMAFNDGAGPKSGKTCLKMAERFDKWLEHNASGSVIETDAIRVEKGTGKFIRPGEDPAVETESPYSVDDEHLKEWVEFLRHCGGFQVC